MELKKRFSFRKVFAAVYLLAFAVYLVIGLQPAEATHYAISGELEIPAVHLYSDVTTLKMHGNTLDAPETIVGEFSRYEGKTLLIGHSTTIFQDLKDVWVGDSIIYGGKEYTVRQIETLAKSEINVDELLLPEDDDTVILMTCAGELLEGGDATHRLIITAS